MDDSGKVSGYEIKLDNGKTLKSSKNSLKVPKLSVGTHTYQVRAIDKDKNKKPRLDKEGKKHNIVIIMSCKSFEHIETPKVHFEDLD